MEETVGIIDLKGHDVARDPKGSGSDFIALARAADNDAVPFCCPRRKRSVKILHGSALRAELFGSFVY